METYDNADHPLPVTEVVLKKLRFVIQQQVGQHMLSSLTVDEVTDFLSDTIAYRLKADLLSKEVRTEVIESIEVPSTWWEHLKQRFAPQWFTDRYPVQFTRFATEVRHYHLCPHLNVASHADHIRFFTQN